VEGGPALGFAGRGQGPRGGVTKAGMFFTKIPGARGRGLPRPRSYLEGQGRGGTPPKRFRLDGREKTRPRNQTDGRPLGRMVPSERGHASDGAQRLNVWTAGIRHNRWGAARIKHDGNRARRGGGSCGRGGVGGPGSRAGTADGTSTKWARVKTWAGRRPGWPYCGYSGAGNRRRRTHTRERIASWPGGYRRPTRGRSRPSGLAKGWARDPQGGPQHVAGTANTQVAKNWHDRENGN